MDSEQEYITLTQAAQELEWNKATVYDWIKTLGIQTHKFVRNKNTFLHIADVARLKEIKAKPWTAGPNTAKRDRNIAEKAKKQAISSKAIDDTKTIEKPQKATTTRKKADLPDGCILAFDFAKNHDVKRETFRDHMLIGLGPGIPWGMGNETTPEKEHVDYSERPKPSRPKEKERYLTNNQQLATLEFWKKHKVNFSQCEREDCPCHQ